MQWTSAENLPCFFAPWGDFTNDTLATAKAKTAGEVKLSLLNSAGSTVAVSALDSDTLATKYKMTAGVYYLGVTCANVNKYSTDYTVTADILAS